MCHGRVKRQPSKVLGATTELGLLGGWGDSRGELISQETRHRDNDNARPTVLMSRRRGSSPTQITVEDVHAEAEGGACGGGLSARAATVPKLTFSTALNDDGNHPDPESCIT